MTNFVNFFFTTVFMENNKSILSCQNEYISKPYHPKSKTTSQLVNYMLIISETYET